MLGHRSPRWAAGAQPTSPNYPAFSSSQIRAARTGWPQHDRYISVSLSGKARLAGVMGWPVGHSRSPSLHGHGSSATASTAPMSPCRCGRRMSSSPFGHCRAWASWAGTSPSRIRRWPAAGRRARPDGGEDRCREHGAGPPDGRTRGLNSGGLGFLANLRQESADWRPEQGAVLVLGAGGAARAWPWPAGGRRPGPATGQSHRGAGGGTGRRAGGHWPG